MRNVALRWIGIFVLWAVALPWAGAAGEPARLEAVLLDGNRVNLEQWKGKVVMVNFWATWCPVCRAEMPQWQKFYDANRSRGFEMIAVSVDDGEEEVRAFMAAKGYTFPVAWRFDKREDDDFPTVRATPTTYFVDRQGRVATMLVGQISGGHLEQTVEHLLAR